VEESGGRSKRSLDRFRERIQSRFGVLGAGFVAILLVVPSFAPALIGSGPGLVVAVRPPGSGVVVGPGFDCEDECSYEGGLPATFTAIAKPGYTFKGWARCDAGGVSGSRCTVGSGGGSVAATFVATPTLTVSKADGLGTVNSSPAGISCSAFCTSVTAKFLGGAKVTLKPVPAKHFHFVEWLGDCVGSGACELLMSQDHEVEALFGEDPKYTLTLTKIGDGQGVVRSKPAGISCIFTCTDTQAVFYTGQTVMLEALAYKGDTFEGWSGSCGGLGACVISMDKAKKVSAEFGPTYWEPGKAHITES